MLNTFLSCENILYRHFSTSVILEINPSDPPGNFFSQATHCCRISKKSFKRSEPILKVNNPHFPTAHYVRRGRTFHFLLIIGGGRPYQMIT